MTKEEIEDYIQAVVEHALSNVEYSNYFLSEIKGYADAAQEACSEILFSHKRNPTKRQKSEVDDEIASVLVGFKNDIDDFVAAEVQKVIQNETEYLNNIIGKLLGISLVIPATAVTMLSMIPMSAAGTPEAFGEYVSSKLGKIYNSITDRGYIFGEKYEDFIDEYDSQFNAFSRGLDADAETIGYSMANEFDRIVYTKNDKKLPGYVWVSMLDTNTCLECASLSGTRYERIEDVPYFPRHDRDRCVISVVTDEIADNIPESYLEWFEKQKDKDKYKILGKSRFQLYEQGMKIKQFVNNGKKTPLKDLKIDISK